MKEIIKLSFILLLISLVAATALALTNELTADRIQDQKDLKNDLARKAVLPAAETFELLPEAEIEALKASFPILSDVYKGISAGETVGYVVRTAPGGYAGEVEVVTGIDLAGALTGVRVGKHTETPGLGAKATLPEFYDQYTGKVGTAVRVNKAQSSETEVQAIAGATITSNAVTLGVNTSAEVVSKIQGQ